MRGNFQVRFLGEGAVVMLLPYPTHLGALPQLQALKVPVADKRPGKHETDQDAMPVHNRGEGSKPKGFVTRSVMADSRERPAPSFNGATVMAIRNTLLTQKKPNFVRPAITSRPKIRDLWRKI